MMGSLQVYALSPSMLFSKRFAQGIRPPISPRCHRLHLPTPLDRGLHGVGLRPRSMMVLCWLLVYLQPRRPNQPVHPMPLPCPRLGALALVSPPAVFQPLLARAARSSAPRPLSVYSAWLICVVLHVSVRLYPSLHQRLEGELPVGVLAQVGESEAAPHVVAEQAHAMAAADIDTASRHEGTHLADGDLVP